MTNFKSEKRGKARIEATQEVVVKEQGTQKILGTLANLHTDGLMVISSIDIQEGEAHQLMLVAEEDLPPVTLSAESLWNSSTGTGEQFWIGFQIVSCDESCQESLGILIGRFADE